MGLTTLSQSHRINLIAVELEHPFGDDSNDIDVSHTIHEFNDHLRVLVDMRARHSPKCVSLERMRDETDNDMFTSVIFDPEMEELAALRERLRPSATKRFVKSHPSHIQRPTFIPHGVKRKNRSTSHPPMRESIDTGDASPHTSAP